MIERQGLVHWESFEIDETLRVESILADFGDVTVQYIHGELSEEDKGKVSEYFPSGRTIHYIDVAANLD